MFRDKEITFDQLKCRLAEKNQNVRYKCLDDLRGTLGPEIEKGMNDELFYKLYAHDVKDGKKLVAVSEFQKETQPWQSNEHCLRSLYSESKKPANQTGKIRKLVQEEMQVKQMLKD